jgi:hypothetical protein
VKKKLSNVESDLIEGLERLLLDLKTGESIGKKYRRKAPQIKPRKRRLKRTASRATPVGGMAKQSGSNPASPPAS